MRLCRYGTIKGLMQVTWRIIFSISGMCCWSESLQNFVLKKNASVFVRFGEQLLYELVLLYILSALGVDLSQGSQVVFVLKNIRIFFKNHNPFRNDSLSHRSSPTPSKLCAIITDTVSLLQLSKYSSSASVIFVYVKLLIKQ